MTRLLLRSTAFIRAAQRAGYDLRIVFRFVEYEGAEAILVETIGSREDVY